jgi:hypothetical protein
VRKPSLATGGERVGEGVDAGDVDRPGVGAQQGRDHPQGRGLARAVGPEQREDPPGLAGELEIVDGLQDIALAVHRAPLLA